MKLQNLFISTIAIIFYLIFFNSCETIVNVDLPKIEPQLVVNCIANPEYPWQISLTLTKDILDDGKAEQIKNANIEISENGHNAITLTHDKDGIYKSNGITPVNNVEYKLKISAAGYKTVTSKCIIPSIIPIENIEIDTIGDFENRKLSLSITFTDKPIEENFYSLNIFSFYNGDTLNASPVWFESDDLLLKGEDDDNLFEGKAKTFRGGEAFFTDEIIDGKKYTLIIDFDIWDRVGNQKFIVVLNSLSKDYYKYIETLKAQRQTKDNPFAEPVIVYSNINNGLGIFAGYSFYKYKLY